MANIELKIDEMITPKEAAATLGMAVVTLAKQRAEGRGLPYIRFGRKIMYCKSAIENHLRGCVIEPSTNSK